MILLDANAWMDAAGAEHPHKAPSLALLARVARGTVDAAADVDVLQEVLHRYRAIGRWRDGRRVFDLARKIVPTWYPVDLAALDRARELLEGGTTLEARNALHAAVDVAVGAEALCTFDRDFDRIAGLWRVEPGEIGGSGPSEAHARDRDRQRSARTGATLRREEGETRPPSR